MQYENMFSHKKRRGSSTPPVKYEFLASELPTTYRGGGFRPQASFFLPTRSQIYRMATTIQTLQTG